MNDRDRDKNIKSLWRHIEVMKKDGKTLRACMHCRKRAIRLEELMQAWKCMHESLQ